MYKNDLKQAWSVNIDKPGLYFKRTTAQTDPVGFHNHGRPIPNGVGYGYTISNYIRGLFDQKCTFNISPPFPEPVRSEVYRFWCALLAYYESSNPVLTPDQICRIITMEVEGITYLKKVRAYAFQLSYDTLPIQVSEESEFYYEEAKKFVIKDLGDFFNVRYWLFWDQPDPKDYDFCFKELSYDKDYIEEFQQECMNILPDILPTTIEEEEILLSVTGIMPGVWKKILLLTGLRRKVITDFLGYHFMEESRMSRKALEIQELVLYYLCHNQIVSS